MDAELLLTCTLVFGLAVVQSLFGMGLLVFGTPCLLLAGFSFVDALLWLLPASFAISVVQIRHGWHELDSFKREFLVCVVPPTALGLVGVLALSSQYDVRAAIGGLLLVSAAARLFPEARARVGDVLSRQRRSVLVLTGFVHGFTNMGGALLAVLIPSLHSDKERIRAHIAFAYLVFVATQIFVLLGTGFDRFRAEHALSPLIALLAYLLIGRRVFAGASRTGYAWAMTGFTLVFGLTLVGAAIF